MDTSPVFSFRPQSSAPKGMLSLRDLYISYTEEDPSEYEFASYVFGDYLVWENLTKWPPLMSYLEEWRKVGEAKRKSKAFKLLLKEVQTEGKNSFSAAKYLIEEPWRKGTKEKAASRKVTKEVQETFKDDLERLKEASVWQ